MARTAGFVVAAEKLRPTVAVLGGAALRVKASPRPGSAKPRGAALRPWGKDANRYGGSTTEGAVPSLVGAKSMRWSIGGAFWERSTVRLAAAPFGSACGRWSNAGDEAEEVARVRVYGLNDLSAMKCGVWSGQPNVGGKVIAWSGTAFTLSVSSGTLSTNYNGGTLNVAGVTATITTVIGTNVVNVTAAPTIPFVLHDDDDATDARWRLPRDPNTGFMASTDDIASNKLKPAYIRPKYNGGGNAAWNTHTVPFICSTESPSVYVWDSRANNSTRFWVVYILSSFQDSYNGLTYDRDCNGESATGGSTAKVGGSLIYLEQLRERYPSATDKDDLEKRIVIHEVGHALKLDHGDGTDNPTNNGIMNRSLQYAPTALMRFIDRHLDALRKLNKPNN